MLDRYRFIAIEGPIGTGKTALARELAARLNARLVADAPEENPYLTRYYQDMPRYALPTQLSFLMQRLRHMEAIQATDGSEQRVISDFVFGKEGIFAEWVLGPTELPLYQDIARRCVPARLPTPDLVVYLQAAPDLLAKRIAERGLAYEAPITEDYLRPLVDAYSRYFHAYEASPLLIVNAAQLDFAKRPQDVDWLMNGIANLRGQREFINLG